MTKKNKRICKSKYMYIYIYMLSCEHLYLLSGGISDKRSFDRSHHVLSCFIIPYIAFHNLYINSNLKIHLNIKLKLTINQSSSNILRAFRASLLCLDISELCVFTCFIFFTLRTYTPMLKTFHVFWRGSVLE